MKISLISSFFLLPPISLTFFCAISSCSGKNIVDESIKDLNGRNWKGWEYGLFKENDYIINYNDKSVTYINGLTYYGTDVVIPDYVWVKDEKFKVLLGPRCFKNNHFLQGNLEFNIHTTFIPEECFYNCDGLDGILFKNYITSFEKKCFYNCMLLEKILSPPIYMSRVQYFKDYCFYGALLDHSFIFGNELKEIGAHAFSLCHGLHSIDLSHNSFITKISDYAFCACDLLKKIIMPTSLKEIGSNAFSQCSELQTVVLPERDMEIAIDDYAFFDCREFTGFSRKCTFSLVGNYCFSGCDKFALDCDSLKNDKLNEIGIQAFAQCYNSSIHIPKNIKYIDEFAFYRNNGIMGAICVLDFSDYTANDDVLQIAGSKVFWGAEDSGIIYLNPSVNIEKWKEALTNKGFTIGPSAWCIFIKNK